MILLFCQQLINVGAGEMDPQLRASTILPTDSNLAPSTHVGRLTVNHLEVQLPGSPTTLASADTCAHVYIPTHKSTKFKIIKKEVFFKSMLNAEKLNHAMKCVF